MAFLPVSCDLGGKFLLPCDMQRLELTGKCAPGRTLISANNLQVKSPDFEVPVMRRAARA
jgi:hypothetical protein